MAKLRMAGKSRPWSAAALGIFLLETVSAGLRVISVIFFSFYEKEQLLPHDVD
jgi:hypothetical protein